MNFWGKSENSEIPRKNEKPEKIRKPPTKADIGKTYYTVYVRDSADDINTDHISLEIERRKFGITKTETGHVCLSLVTCNDLLLMISQTL